LSEQETRERIVVVGKHAISPSISRPARSCRSSTPTSGARSTTAGSRCSETWPMTCEAGRRPFLLSRARLSGPTRARRPMARGIRRRDRGTLEVADDDGPCHGRASRRASGARRWTRQGGRARRDPRLDRPDVAERTAGESARETDSARRG
jgi:hypothetical protein